MKTTYILKRGTNILDVQDVVGTFDSIPTLLEYIPENISLFPDSNGVMWYATSIENRKFIVYTIELLRIKQND